MERPAIELVLQALDALYRNDDVSEKEKASQWLMQLQASVNVLIIAHRPFSLPLLDEYAGLTRYKLSHCSMITGEGLLV